MLTSILMARLCALLCSILYQRGMYPSDSFKLLPYHGLNMMVTKDKDLKHYLDTVMGQMQGAPQ